MVYTLLFFPLQNALCFIILTYLVPVLFTFYTQGVLKLNNSGGKRLSKTGARGTFKKPHAFLRKVHGLTTTVVTTVVDAGGTVNRCFTVFQIPATYIYVNQSN
jgi:hypothetical protein